MKHQSLCSKKQIKRHYLLKYTCATLDNGRLFILRETFKAFGMRIAAFAVQMVTSKTAFLKNY